MMKILFYPLDDMNYMVGSKEFCCNVLEEFYKKYREIAVTISGRRQNPGLHLYIPKGGPPVELTIMRIDNCPFCGAKIDVKVHVDGGD